VGVPKLAKRMLEIVVFGLPQSIVTTCGIEPGASDPSVTPAKATNVSKITYKYAEV
jgi:hypothetical protein